MNQRLSTLTFVMRVLLCVFLVVPGALVHADDAQTAAKVFQETGITGGLVVHIGSGDGQLTAALRLGDQYIIHGVDTDAAKIKAARKTIQSKNIYGPVFTIITPVDGLFFTINFFGYGDMYFLFILDFLS